jgi:hypothetical protein
MSNAETIKNLFRTAQTLVGSENFLDAYKILLQSDKEFDKWRTVISEEKDATKKKEYRSLYKRYQKYKTEKLEPFITQREQEFNEKIKKTPKKESKGEDTNTETNTDGDVKVDEENADTNKGEPIADDVKTVVKRNYWDAKEDSEIYQLFAGVGDFVMKFIINFKNKLADRLKAIMEFFEIFSEEDIKRIQEEAKEEARIINTDEKKQSKDTYWQAIKGGVVGAAGWIWGTVKEWTPDFFVKAWQWVKSVASKMYSGAKEFGKNFTPKGIHDNAEKFGQWFAQNKRSIRVSLVIAKYIRDKMCWFLTQAFGEVELKLDTYSGRVADSYGASATVAQDLICLNFNDMMQKFISASFDSIKEYSQGLSNPWLGALLGIATGGTSVVLGGIASIANLIKTTMMEDIKESIHIASLVQSFEDAISFVKNNFFDNKCITTKAIRINPNSAEDKEKLIQYLTSEPKVAYLAVDNEVNYYMARKKQNLLVKFWTETTNDIPFLKDMGLEQSLCNKVYREYIIELEKRASENKEPNYVEKLRSAYFAFREYHPELNESIFKMIKDKFEPYEYREGIQAKPEQAQEDYQLLSGSLSYIFFGTKDNRNTENLNVEQNKT